MCVKFQKELPGLDAPPWPGELGQRIYDNVSEDAWKLWEERMKMILNEYRLMPWQKEAQDLVAKHMEDFFFGEGAALPPGYVPQQTEVASRCDARGIATASAGTAGGPPHIPDDLGFHTIEDGQLLFCAHPMWFPVVGYQFDVRNCGSCDYFKPVPPARFRASAYKPQLKSGGIAKP